MNKVETEIRLSSSQSFNVPQQFVHSLLDLVKQLVHRLVCHLLLFRALQRFVDLQLFL